MNKTKKITLFALMDLILMVGAWCISFAIRGVGFDYLFGKTYYFLIAEIVVVFAMFSLLRLYSVIWRYAGVREALKIIVALLSVFLINIIIYFCTDALDFEWAIVVSGIFSIFFVISRFAVICWGVVVRTLALKRNSMGGIRTIIIGAGDAGCMLINDMMTSDKMDYFPVCILDDDESKIGQYINGVKVAGKTSAVVKYASLYRAQEIIIAMPAVSEKIKSKIIHRCSKTNCKIKIIPGLYQLVTEKLTVTNAKDVKIQDLLGREQVKVNLDEIMGYIENKVVLVTGGGGSIGSELCRQIARHNPKQLIILDVYENNAYDIQQELVRHCPDLHLTVLIASVRDSKKINNVFEQYKPQIVFHAAAHKHVPLMEKCPNEAVKNNVSGTFKVADAAGRNGTERFILISTDKAVNPTNIMGATKRICEMIIQTMNKKYPTEYVAVRFGNVLGSNGSVIPLFKKQIEEGGPVTITHKDIVRYFMTIQEAVSLVLQAGAYAKGGEIFVLDMGEPVKIYDLAVNMIKLSGHEPYKDIDIVVTGLRPGEKLYEERLMEEEGLQKTANEMISIGKPLEIDEKNLFDKIQQLYIEAYNETDKMKELVHELVPTYKIDTRKDI